MLMDTIRRLRDRSIQRELTRLTRQITDPTTPRDARDAAIRRQMDLRRAKMASLHRRVVPTA